MIKCEIKDDKVEIVFRGTAEEVFGELLEIIEEYADQFLHVPLGKFIEMLGETNKLVMAKKYETQAEAEERAAQLNKEEAEK